jgi:signal transduction histidine kinase/ligand-binding sensor domain-containing protein/DNA-binding response OmpR family regulator
MQRRLPSLAVALAILFGSALALHARPVQALDPTRRITQYVVDNWQIQQGLPQNTVQALAQTRDGYLWLGTQEGLVRFDGARFVVFDPRNTPELASKVITALQVDRTGRLWVGTRAGVAIFDGERFESQRSLANTLIRAMAKSQRDGVWIGTESGIVHTAGTAAVPLDSAELAGLKIRLLHEGKDGSLWISTEAHGTYRYASGRLEQIAPAPGASLHTRALHEDDDGTLWLGTEQGSLYTMRDRVLSRVHTDWNSGAASIRAVTRDRDGSLWVATYSGGLFRRTEEQWTWMDPERLLPTGDLLGFLEDHEASLWIGTNGGGLVRLRDGKVTPLGEPEGLAGDMAWSVAPTRNNGIWIATDSGISRYAEGRIEHIAQRFNLHKVRTRSVVEDRSGTVWFGTEGRGVYRLRNGELAHLGPVEGLTGTTVKAIFQDARGRILFGTNTGLQILDGDQFIALPPALVRLGTYAVSFIHEDSSARLWLALESGGLVVLDGDRLHRYGPADGLRANRVLSIFEDRRGDLWVGTSQGIALFAADRFLSRDALDGETVQAILEDGDSQLWLSTNKGLFVVDRDALAAHVRGGGPSPAVHRFGLPDGLRTSEFNGGNSAAACQTPDGKLWFASIRGVAGVDPAFMRRNLLAPSVLLEETIVDGRHLSSGQPRAQLATAQPISVPAGASSWEFKYTALSLRAPERVAFKYRLEGFDRDWIDAGNRRTAYYTALPPGDYSFRVIASNDDGVWNDQGAVLRFTLEPRFFQTRWFLALCAAMAVCAIAVVYRARVGHLRRQAAEMERLIAERTADLAAAKEEAELARAEALAGTRAKSEFLANMSHEIRTPMNGVVGMTQLLLETPLNATQRDYTETVRDSAAALLTVINDILDFSKIEAGKLEIESIDMNLRDTVEDVARLLALQAHAKGLELAGHIDPTLPDLVKGDPGRLRQILINLGANAIKFTRTGEVEIALKVLETDAAGSLVRCTVRDTGVGIPAPRLNALFQPFTQVDASTTRKFGGTGLGLSIVKRLAELMGGEVGAESTEGVGSTFWFTVRLGAAAGGLAEKRIAHEKLRGMRVLVVDDNATNRRVVAGLLELDGIEAVCEGAPEPALTLLHTAAAAGRPFQVALLDFQMPECDGTSLGQRIAADPRLRDTRLVLLTSAGQRGDTERCEQLGFAGYLLKPVSRRELTACLELVMACNADVWHSRSQPIVTRQHVSASRAPLHRLLLAEDNLVNQKVARIMLEKLDYQVDIVGNGREAVTAWETGRYELILMDCQMPELDGFEASREIRRLEGGAQRIPIVALTAHAMQGAEAECLAAGMDDYLSKPLDRSKLVACLERHLRTGPRLTGGAEAPTTVGAETTDPVDWDSLLTILEGDEFTARELVMLFMSSGNEALSALATALDNGDRATVLAQAHALKGASGNLQAHGVSAVAGRLESAAREGVPAAELRSLAAELRGEVDRAVAWLRSKTAPVA